METAGKIFRAFLLFLFLGAMWGGCEKEKEKYGTLTVRMTDAPAAYLQVNVDINRMQVHHERRGWMELRINRGVYDLLKLQNNVTVVLADSEQVPLGKITQLRLILGTNNTLVDATGTHELAIPGGAETGLKVNVGQVIAPDTELEIVLDFDANASVVLHGNGSYSLKPVIKLKSVKQT